MPSIKPMRHDEELTIVGHLEELRGRLIVCVAAFVVAFSLCMWQNHLVLEILNAPLGGREPITLSPAEPFTTTLTVSAYAAILLAMPIVLHQLYAFVLPVFSPKERQVALPLLLAVPVLFILGILFAYEIVVPAALKFLLNFNKGSFNIEIRAKDYYGFMAQTLIALGLVFQVPVGILAATRLGITNATQLRQVRRYAVLVIAVIAMALPGTDPVTMLITMVPLLVLYELSIVLAAVFGGSRDTVASPPAADAP